MELLSRTSEDDRQGARGPYCGRLALQAQKPTPPMGTTIQVVSYWWLTRRYDRDSIIVGCRAIQLKHKSCTKNPITKTDDHKSLDSPSLIAFQSTNRPKLTAPSTPFLGWPSTLSASRRWTSRLAGIRSTFSQPRRLYVYPMQSRVLRRVLTSVYCLVLGGQESKKPVSHPNLPPTRCSAKWSRCRFAHHQ